MHRAFKICSTWQIFDDNIKKLKLTLQRNKFPPKLINRETKNYLNKVYEVEQNKEDKKIDYYKLPYLGDVSKYTQKRIRELCKSFCKTLEITRSFNTCKLGSFLSTKSVYHKNFKSKVVYHFNCPGCAASYVGHTIKIFKDRVNEHLGGDKNSHIYKHIMDNNKIECKRLSNENSFKIIDFSNTEFVNKIKEAIHVKSIRPTINAQKNLNLTLLI